jgi:hypothetical protein
MHLHELSTDFYWFWDGICYPLQKLLLFGCSEGLGDNHQQQNKGTQESSTVSRERERKGKMQNILINENGVKRSKHLKLNPIKDNQ